MPNRNRSALGFLMILALGLVTACSNNAYTPIVNPTQPIDPAAYAPKVCLLYTSPSPRDRTRYRMPSSA